MACAALAVSASAAAAQGPAVAPPAAGAAAEAVAKAPVLDRAGLDALLAAPAGVVVLDVRRADEISAIGGFPAYLNIKLAELERLLAYIPRDRKIVTVSNHANRAKRAAAVLERHGFDVAGAAGAQDYEAQGGALTGKRVVAAVGQ